MSAAVVQERLVEVEADEAGGPGPCRRWVRRRRFARMTLIRCC